jgi:hypothetical protein
MRILLIGANNDLSRKIYERLFVKGYEVHKTSRDRNESDFYFEIDDESSWKNYENIDVIIYTAWKMSPRNLNVSTKNILAAKTILSLNSDINLIFISSMSANRFSISQYGAAKYQVEKEYLKFGKHVVKPGILYDPTNNSILGSVGNTMRIINQLIFLPSISPDFSIFISNVDELAQGICDIIEDKDLYRSLAKSVSFNLFIKKFTKPKNLQVSFQSNFIDKALNILPSQFTFIGNLKDSWKSLSRDSLQSFLDDDKTH